MKILKSGSYYGRKKGELNHAGFLLSEYGYHQQETDWHYHENPYFMYVLAGNLKDLNRKETVLCPSGSFIFHNWQDQHKNTKETSYAKGFHIELDRSWFSNICIGFELIEGSGLLKDPRLHRIFMEIYREFHTHDKDSKIALECLMIQLCSGLKNESEVSGTKPPTWLDTLKEIIHEDCENMNLETLSKELNIHPVHLSRSVPKYLKTTLGDYIRRSKLKKSFPLLMDMTYSLTEIAHLSGFSDQSHFTRTFKLYFDQTPSDFRKLL